MKIRSVTSFASFNPAVRASELRRLQSFTSVAVSSFQSAGFEVQTTRLSTPPFPGLLPVLEPSAAVDFATQAEALAAEHGFNYLSLGSALPEKPRSYELVVPMLAATRDVFLSGFLTNGSAIDLPAVRACGQVIADAAPLTPDGFTNLRFAALANHRPFGPFFPSSFGKGDGLSFSLAVECADVAVETCAGDDAADAVRALVERLEAAAEKLCPIARRLARRFGIRFRGFDFSLAPFPQDACSLGGAFERLGPGQVGLHGSLAAGALLASALDRGRWPRAGFNGLMMPVLEDSILALRSAQGTLNLKDLLMFSAVCGAGLDTVPLPGDSSPQALSAVLVDVAALALRLGKPLTARLMPVPGKKAGDPTGFDFAFFANGGVMPLQAEPLAGLLGGSGQVPLTLRKPRAFA